VKGLEGANAATIPMKQNEEHMITDLIRSRLRASGVAWLGLERQE